MNWVRIWQRELSVVFSEVFLHGICEYDLFPFMFPKEDVAFVPDRRNVRFIAKEETWKIFHQAIIDHYSSSESFKMHRIFHPVFDLWWAVPF